MHNKPDLYIPLIYFLAAVPYTWLGFYVWRIRSSIAVTSFTWMMFSAALWSLAYSFELFSPSLAAKIFILKIEHFGIVSLPVFLFIFTLEFTGNHHLLAARARFLLWVIPLIALILVWSNELHHLMWGAASLDDFNGLKLLHVDHVSFFWVQIAFSYILMAVSSILLIIEIIQQSGRYRVGISFVIIGILLPWIGTIIFITGISPIPNIDPAPLLFLPTGIGLSWAIIRFHLLEILPVQHLNVLKNMKDGMIVLSSERRILYLNPTAEKLLNCAESDAIAKPLAHVSEVYAKKLSPYLTGTEQQAEITIGKNEQMTVFEVTISLAASQRSLQASRKPDSIITLHEITKRKEIENTLSRRESIMSAISLTAEQFLRDSVWEKNISGVLAKIGQAADVSRVYVGMNYTGKDGLIYSSLCYEWVAPGFNSQMKNPAFQHVPLRPLGFGKWENMLSERNSILANVKGFSIEEQMIFQSNDSISIAAAPIFVDNEWWGFIMLDECLRERHWTRAEIEALQITASIFGSAESRARAEYKLTRRQRALDLLHEIVTISLQAENMKDMAQTVVDRLGELINADGCFLSLWDETNKRTVPLTAYGEFRDTYTSLSPQPGELTFTESVLTLGKPLIIEDASITPYSALRITKNFPSVSILVLPLIIMEKKLGSLLLSFNRLHQFLPEEISISEQASAVVALALEKFQAVEKAHKRADTSETLRKAGVVVTEKLELTQTVEHILEQLQQVVPYDSASVQLIEDNKLHIVGGRGWENLEDIIGIKFPVPGDNPNSIVIETGKPYYLPETWKVYEKFNEPPHNHIRSWLGAPLIVQERIIGLLAIDSSEPGHFTEEDIKIASEFATQVAGALENARIFKESRDQAFIDPLTGVYNRRGLFEIGRIDFDRSIRLNLPFSGIMIDIDHFKKINDTHGHIVGDRVLHEFAKCCKSYVREMDYVSRYGGEEFFIILPETNLETGKLVAERLRGLIASSPIIQEKDLELNITASLGIAQRDENTNTLETLIARADQALYVAKHKGRNRVAINV